MHQIECVHSFKKKLFYTSLTKLTFCYISLQAADFVNVTDKTVLVIGTQNPWLEAVLLTMKPKKIVTLEYGYFIRLGYFMTLKREGGVNPDPAPDRPNCAIFRHRIRPVNISKFNSIL